MKLLRTVSFDTTDERVYARAARPGEWCVPGAFEFADASEATLTGKTRQAFANGFLGLASIGRSTFAVVGEAADGEVEDAVAALARHLVESFGAPDNAAACAAAREEIAFTADLCAQAPINTVFTVRRTHDATGAIAEEFRTIKPPTAEPLHARIWTIEPDEADAPAAAAKPPEAR